MIDATTPRARRATWRVWVAPGPPDRPNGRSVVPYASRAQPVTDASCIGNGLIPRPRAASSHPETNVLVASIILRIPHPSDDARRALTNGVHDWFLRPKGGTRMT